MSILELSILGITTDELGSVANQLRVALTQAGVPAKSAQDVSIHVNEDGVNEKGDPITLGTIAVTFLTSQLALELVKAIQSIMTRKRSMTVELASINGRKVTITAEDVSSVNVDQTLQRLEPLWKS